MKNIRNKFIAAGLISLMFCAGCADLDREYSDAMTKEMIEAEYENARMQVVNLYAGMQDGHYLIDNATRASLADEAEFTPQGVSQLVNAGGWSQYNNPDDVWGHFFDWIRRCNVYLNEMHGKIDLSPWKDDPNSSSQELYYKRKAEMENWEREARFLRAYYHFELVKRYGGIPVMTEVLNLDSDFANVQRNSLEECVNFIVGECDSITGKGPRGAEYTLPFLHPDNDANLGRITKGAVLALKSRVLLYAASDLWNSPDTWASGYTNKELISLGTGKTRQQRWREAADAAYDLIRVESEGGYSITSGYGGLGIGFDNKEYILLRRVGNSYSFESLNFPAGYESAEGNITPSQNMVDLYEMRTDGSKFDWNNPEHAADPYANRDPRMDLTVYRNGASFKTDIVIETFNGGEHSNERQTRGTTTGYYLRKFVDPNINLVQPQGSNHPWIIFRIGEIYLNYAEALNECDPGNAQIATYANKTRGRNGVNMPSIPAELSQSEMRGRIRNERAVEFAMEDHRLWDARRWMIAADHGSSKGVFNMPLRGINIVKNEDQLTFTPVNVENRTFLPKMYFYPIPNSVMLNEAVVAAGWPQNPLW